MDIDSTGDIGSVSGAHRMVRLTSARSIEWLAAFESMQSWAIGYLDDGVRYSQTKFSASSSFRIISMHGGQITKWVLPSGRVKAIISYSKIHIRCSLRDVLNPRA